MDANTIINRLGGTQAAADLCRISKGAVSQWRRDGIPEARLMFLKLARPDVFDEGASGKRIAAEQTGSPVDLRSEPRHGERRDEERRDEVRRDDERRAAERRDEERREAERRTRAA